MAPRCRPGDLCEIVKSLAGNEGRRGVIERAATAEDWACGNGMLLNESHGEPLWLFMPLQPLRSVIDLRTCDPLVKLGMGPTLYPDSWLRPIREPDSDATDDAVSVVEVAHA